MKKTFVGFGFGPIQGGLFLLEAHRSGNFSRLVVAEIDEQLVRAARAAGAYTINVAGPDAIRAVNVPRVELYNPRDAGDRLKLIEAIAAADELATALPSVRFFDTGEPDDAAELLARGFARRGAGRPGILYAAENHNHAAEILREKVAARAAGGLEQVQFLNTVIGKMSGVITDDATIRRLKLEPLLPGLGRAVLVEKFNRILVSRVALPGVSRGIEVFIEKDDLIPFEEAKLYGHNAIHALIGYLSALRGYETLAQAGADAELMAIARTAFIDESGSALIRRWRKLNDPLFTPEGYREYAEDLLARMVCPNLNDLVTRVVRDPQRKLAWEDRFFGTMRIALDHGIGPRNLAMGAGAAVIHLMESHGRTPAREELPGAVEAELRSVWGGQAGEHAEELVRRVSEAVERLKS